MQYKILWTPDPDFVKKTQVHKYIKFVNAYSNKQLKTYDDLYSWSVENIFFSMPGQANEWAIDIEGSLGEDKDRVRVLIPVPVTE